MAKKDGRFSLSIQLLADEGRNRSRILKNEILDRFHSEAEALAEFKALLAEILDDDDEDED